LSGSAHDYLSELIQSPFNVPELLRAQSEKMLNCSEEGDFKQEMLRSILDNSELCNCQRQLQKAIEEKQELQVLVETLRSELKKIQLQISSFQQSKHYFDISKQTNNECLL
uniref:TEDC2 protein n=1 Tax=Anisakis simplex TaxID=6269 RepID=A0A0M3JAG0_ANISI